MKRYWWLLILLAALLLWLATGWGESVPTIHFSTSRRGTLASTVPTNGVVEPVDWSAATAEIAGVVRTVEVKLGQNVQAGQILVSLDPTSARSDLAAALARQQEAQAETNTLGQGGKAATVAELNDRIAAAGAAVDIAQRIYEADKRLLQQQAATKLQVDTDADALERAKLNLLAARNQKKSSVTTSDQTVAQARLRDAQAAVALAQHRIDLAEIRSPMAGTVYAFDLKVGAYLQPGYPVAKIGNIDRVKVIVYVDEPDLGRVGLGMPVSITSDSRPGQKWWGTVDKLPTEVTALGTRTVGQVSTIVDNPGHELLPGVSVNVTIVSRTVNDALLIPKAALRRLGNTNGVYVLDGKKLAWKQVQTGISDINNVQILSGLQAGQHVADRAIDPSDAEIRNGMRLKPVFN